MKKNKLVFSTLIGIICIQFFISSCAKLSEEEMVEDFIYCKEDSVSFQNNVLPIIMNDCATCHSGVNAPNGVILDNYTDIQAYAGAGDLMSVINHASGYPPMPSGKPKLNECKITTLQKWIDEGMLNN